jgi:hypothetical protein
VASASSRDLGIKLIFTGGDADGGMLDLHDASESYNGLARALAYTSHALVHEGVIRHRATRLDCANIYIQPSKQGSFEENLLLAFNQLAIDKVGISVLVPAFWDLLRWGWLGTIGETVVPQTPFVKRLIDDVPDLEGELLAALEPSIISIHRPIQQNRNIQLVVNRPRVGDILKFNSNSLDYVSQTTEGAFERNVKGNITKYNILGIHGRLYLDSAEKTVPFILDASVTPEEKRLLTWSMDQYSLRFPSKLSLDIRPELSANREIKRVHIFAVRHVIDAQSPIEIEEDREGE